MLKQFEAHDFSIGGYEFHIFPFSSFKAANLSGELTKTLAPVVPVLASLFKSNDTDSILGSDASSVVSALQNIDGDKLEGLLKKLLIKDRNVSIEVDGVAEPLTEEKANEIFCGSVDDMFMLAIEVIKVNYSGFFAKLGLQFGSAGDHKGQKTT